MDRAHLPELCEQVDRLIAVAPTEHLLCRLGRPSHPLTAVDILARLQLLARRRGCTLWLQAAPAEVRRAIALAGLDEVLPDLDG